jgi:hypothetical protein
MTILHSENIACTQSSWVYTLVHFSGFSQIQSEEVAMDYNKHVPDQVNN